jgi:hypothetical protein
MGGKWKGRKERAEDEGMVANVLGKGGGFCLRIGFVGMLVFSKMYKRMVWGQRGEIDLIETAFWRNFGIWLWNRKDEGNDDELDLRKYKRNVDSCHCNFY